MVDSTGALPPVTSQDRHFRVQSKSSRRRTVNHRVRLAAKRYAAQYGDAATEDICKAVGLPCSGTRPAGSDNPGARRLHLEAELHALKRVEEAFAPSAGRPRGTPIHRGHPRLDDDGIDLARSDVPFPSDRYRSSMVRQPSLEREDAFCDASSFRGKVRVQRAAPAMPVDDDAQIAELYRMGLLYDDGEVRSGQNSVFDLNTIRHEEPVYIIRPSRRGGRRQGKAHGQGYERPLCLNLSFADLGHDDDIAQFLVSSQQAPSASSSSAGDGAIQHSPRRHSRQTSAPLRVVYELAGSRPSFDVDTSQPPDLVTDSLSDYDYFSDSDLDDDAPSQTEVHDVGSATGATDPWVMLGDGS
jgi:hypothetical protein